MRDITELPCDLFLLIIAYLPPRTCIRCRQVSRQWHEAFTSEDISLLLLRWNFPRCREMRLAAADASLSSLSSKALESLSSNNLAVELKCFAAGSHSWSSTFAAVARRYHHLRHAKPRVVDKIELAGLNQDQDGGGSSSAFSFRGVAQWNRYLRLDQNTANFHYDDPSWWYSQEDGVLVYPAAETRIDARDESQPEVLIPEPETGYIYQVLDLSTGTQVPVPFDVRQKHIRRVRLAQGVLVFEWAEALPYHQLNDREVVHRHFVTAFDVVRIPSELSVASPDTTSESGDTRWTWTVKLRSEWKLHFLGLPLNRSDRFFSAHTATHYAVYFWQPNRSLYQDDPIEQLAVWDISSPSNYRPSEDPTGDKHPGAPERSHSIPVGLWNGAQNGTNGTHSDRSISSSVHSASSDGDTKPSSSAKAKTKSTPAGPRVIRRMAWRELGFYNLRQRATPQLRNLALDERNLYFVEEEHRWADGQHSSLSPPRVHHVRCTGIPIIPATPACPTSTPPRSGTPKRPPLAVIHNSSSVSVVESPIDGPVLGPIWVDACGADGDVNMSFCRRAAASSGPITALESWATPQRNQLGTLNNASPEYIMGLLKSRGSTSADGWAWTATDTSTLLPSNGKQLNPQDVVSSFISSPQRWPGWAPCWRHEDFPYLTVAEMVDFAAGVRITARHCFMLETISVHVRPGSISVKGATSSAVEEDDDDGDHNGAGPSTGRRPTMTSYQKKKAMNKNKKRRSSSNATTTGAGKNEEVQFADDMWSELVHKGYLAGDERWVLGEDEKGRITVVRF